MLPKELFRVEEWPPADPVELLPTSGTRLLLYEEGMKDAVAKIVAQEVTHFRKGGSAFILPGEGIASENDLFDSWSTAVDPGGLGWRSWNSIDELVTDELIGENPERPFLIVWLDVDLVFAMDAKCFATAVHILCHQTRMAVEGAGSLRLKEGVWPGPKPWVRAVTLLCGRWEVLQSRALDPQSELYRFDPEYSLFPDGETRMEIVRLTEGFR